MPERTVIVSTAPPNPLWDPIMRAAVTGSIRDWPAPWTPASGGEARPWPFGTIVRHVSFATTGLILTDDGTLVRVLMLGRGETVETGRSIWEPV